MIPVATFSPVGKSLLSKNFLANEMPGALRIVKTEEAIIPGIPARKRLTPQQITAGFAFRLFGLHNLPVYNIDTSVMQQGNGIGAPVETVQLLRKFKQTDEVAQNGLIYKNNVADYTSELMTVTEDADVVSFSKILDDKEIVIVYNASETEAKEKFISLHGINTAGVKQLNCIYGFNSCAYVHLFRGTIEGREVFYIKIYLKPMQLAILKNY